MIVRKPKFNAGDFKKSDWPFTVTEVTVISSVIKSNGKMMNAFAIAHEFDLFAISGIIEQYGIKSLKQSGIWKIIDKMEGGEVFYQNLTPFFNHISKMHERTMRKNHGK